MVTQCYNDSAIGAQAVFDNVSGNENFGEPHAAAAPPERKPCLPLWTLWYKQLLWNRSIEPVCREEI